MADLDDKSPEEREETPEQQIERERDALLAALGRGEARTRMQRVAAVLRDSREARNSDVRLWREYWQRYERDAYAAGWEGLHFLTRPTTLTRDRRKVQNTYGLFQADLVVRSRRGVLSEEQKEELRAEQAAVAEALGDEASRVTVYSDEAKSGPFYVVGSVWIGDVADQARLFQRLPLFLERKGWRADRPFEWKRAGRQDADLFVEFVQEAVKTAPSLGFKAAVHSDIGHRSDFTTLAFAHAMLLGVGMEHEVQLRGLALPRSLRYFKDAEGGEEDPTPQGPDSRMLVEIRRQVVGKQGAPGLGEIWQAFGGKVKVRDLTAVDSDTGAAVAQVSVFPKRDHWVAKSGVDRRERLERGAPPSIISLADIFTGVVSAIVNPDTKVSPVRQEIARRLQDSLGIDPGRPWNDETARDLALVFTV